MLRELAMFCEIDMLTELAMAHYGSHHGRLVATNYLDEMCIRSKHVVSSQTQRAGLPLAACRFIGASPARTVDLVYMYENLTSIDVEDKYSSAYNLYQPQVILL